MMLASCYWNLFGPHTERPHYGNAVTVIDLALTIELLKFI